MKRFLSAGFCLGVVIWLTGSPVLAQDRIRYTDRKTGKEATATGTIREESPSQIVYQPGTAAGTKEIPALDVIDVTYDVPGAVKLTYRSAEAEEKKVSSLRDAIKNYQEILPRLAEAKQKFAERHVRFKIARLMARQAEDDPEQLDAAIDALAKFKEQNAASWQVIQCAKTLARLQLAKGDTDAAEKTYEDLAATPNIPEQMRKECDLLVAEAMIRGKKHALAQKKLEAVLKTLPPDDLHAARVRIYLAQCLAASGKLPEATAQLEGIIAKTTEKELKALAYNTLGDCYRLNGRSKEALWPYLWVDVIYHQDRQEHIKAMEQLAKLFDDQGDKARAKQYRDRLKKETR